MRVKYHVLYSHPIFQDVETGEWLHLEDGKKAVMDNKLYYVRRIDQRTGGHNRPVDAKLDLAYTKSRYWLEDMAGNEHAIVGELLV